MLTHFENTIAGIESKLSRQGPDDMVARKRLALASARLGARLYRGDEPVAWCGVLAPFDLLNAFGLASCYVEFVGTILAANGAAGELLETAEHAGFSTDACSYHRTVIGATVAGLMPPPRVVIATSAPCTGGLAVNEEMARRFGVRMFTIQIPLAKDEKAVGYLADQLRTMVDFVTAEVGLKLDEGRLRSAVELSNRARAAMVETYELARSVPTPARPRDLINLGLTMSLLYGTEDGVEVAESYRDEFAAKIGVGKLRPEGLRLMWLQNRIQFQNPVEALLTDQRNAAVVVDELNPITWQPIDPDDPFTGLARRILSVPLCGDIGYRLDHLRRLARDYRVDGAINPCHWGCRQGTGARGLLERGLKAMGVPVLNLEVDCIDQRNFSEGQVRTRVQAFLEMLEARVEGIGRIEH